MTAACISVIVLAIIGGYFFIWALCKTAARADDYTLHADKPPKEWR